MLISIAQRSREITAARDRCARLGHFASVPSGVAVVALAGGAVGVAVGLTVAMGLECRRIVVSRITWLPIAVGFLACTGIGIAFGVQPARKAAHATRNNTAGTSRIGGEP